MTLERAEALQDRGKLFRAYGAVPAGSNHPGVPGWFEPVGYSVVAKGVPGIGRRYSGDRCLAPSAHRSTTACFFVVERRLCHER